MVDGGGGRRKKERKRKGREGGKKNNPITNFINILNLIIIINKFIDKFVVVNNY